MSRKLAKMQQRKRRECQCRRVLLSMRQQNGLALGAHLCTLSLVLRLCILRCELSLLLILVLVQMLMLMLNVFSGT